MLITENKIRLLIKNILKENTGKSKWEKASSFNPSDEIYTELMRAEGKVPFIYDDKDYITSQELYNRLYKYTYNIMSKLKDYPAYLKMEKSAKRRTAKEIATNLYHSDIIKYHRKKLKGPKGIPSPVFNYKKIIGFPSIGYGHLIYKKNQIDEREKYKEYLLPTIIEEMLIERVANSKGRELKELFMSDSDLNELFKSDVNKHTQFKERISKPITQSMFDALTSFAFNAGWEKFHPRSGRKMPIEFIIEKINKGKYQSAASIIKTLATKTAGSVSSYLQKRRKKESERFKKEGLMPPATK